ncbi:PREDICTED: basic leucine zipper transcriptional factor ATF-like 3 [Acanthisitta chloris]|nr:PREDICTED: basic leucine zipper transcriptional factor ATF-like 3 [Acanthisitta chloris]
MRCPSQRRCGQWEAEGRCCEIYSICSFSETVASRIRGVSKRTFKTSKVFLADVFQSHEEDDRKVRRREKNRVAAQRSRKKQTQKADKLHEEYESLEQENTSLKREIGKLTDEMKHLSEVLKDHEKICPLLHCTMNFVTIPRPDALASCLPR